MKLVGRAHVCDRHPHPARGDRCAYETEKIDVGGGATQEPAFLAVNPKGKVPTLVRDDGSMLTEFSAIATWLARTHPEAGLLPMDPEAEARAVEALAYVEGTIHGQGFARIFKPQMFEPQGVVRGALGLGHENVRKQGRAIVEKGFSILDPQLGRSSYAAGAEFSIADLALFYVERWAAQNDISLPINVKAHLVRMLARPAVRKVMELWGETV